MKNLICIAVNIVHILSLCGVMFVVVLGVLYEIIGHAKFDQLLSKFGIVKGFEFVWVVGVITISLLIITSFLKAKVV